MLIETDEQSSKEALRASTIEEATDMIVTYLKSVREGILCRLTGEFWWPQWKTMEAELRTLFDQIEHQQCEINENLLMLSEAQLTWKPKASAWSIRQIVEHLMLCAEIFGHAEKGVPAKPEAMMFRIIPPRWRFAMALSALKHNVVLPFPSPVLEPQGNERLSDLLFRWGMAHSAMEHDLSMLYGDESRYSHPVLGSLSAAQMLELGCVHTAYHVRQMEALQRDPAFPTRSDTERPALWIEQEDYVWDPELKQWMEDNPEE